MADYVDPPGADLPWSEDEERYRRGHGLPPVTSEDERAQDREYVANGGDNEAVARKWQRRRAYAPTKVESPVEPEPIDPAEDDGGAAARGSLTDEQLNVWVESMGWKPLRADGSDRVAGWFDATPGYVPGTDIPVNWDPREQDPDAYPGFRPRVANGPGARPVNPDNTDDMSRWGSTVAYLLESGQMTHDAMTDLDRRAIVAWRTHMDPVTEVYSRALYDALRAELGDLIAPWAELSETARETYRRQGAYVRSAVEAAAPPPVSRDTPRAPSAGIQAWGPLHVGQFVSASVSGSAVPVLGTVSGLHPSWGRDGIVVITPDDPEHASADGFVSCVPQNVTIFGDETVRGE